MGDVQPTETVAAAGGGDGGGGEGGGGDGGGEDEAEVNVYRATAVIGVLPATVFSFEHTQVVMSQSQS